MTLNAAGSVLGALVTQNHSAGEVREPFFSNKVSIMAFGHDTVTALPACEIFNTTGSPTSIRPASRALLPAAVATTIQMYVPGSE